MTNYTINDLIAGSTVASTVSTISGDAVVALTHPYTTHSDLARVKNATLVRSEETFISFDIVPPDGYYTDVFALCYSEFDFETEPIIYVAQKGVKNLQCNYLKQGSRITILIFTVKNDLTVGFAYGSEFFLLNATTS